MICRSCVRRDERRQSGDEKQSSILLANWPQRLLLYAEPHFHRFRSDDPLEHSGYLDPSAPNVAKDSDELMLAWDQAFARRMLAEDNCIRRRYHAHPNTRVCFDFNSLPTKLTTG